MLMRKRSHETPEKPKKHKNDPSRVVPGTPPKRAQIIKRRSRRGPTLPRPLFRASHHPVRSAQSKDWQIIPPLPPQQRRKLGEDGPLERVLDTRPLLALARLRRAPAILLEQQPRAVARRDAHLLVNQQLLRDQRLRRDLRRETRVEGLVLLARRRCGWGRRARGAAAPLLSGRRRLRRRRGRRRRLDHALRDRRAGDALEHRRAVRLHRAAHGAGRGGARHENRGTP
mmetsp:Transcript_13945/g.36635  ORF Transcript_13945/g.36635 Transcript_13945/m.36635 type:complete len:228 (+) Transcript_13945:106-789(+)